MSGQDMPENGNATLTIDINSLTGRIAAVERELRLYRWFAVLLIAVIVALGVLPFGLIADDMDDKALSGHTHSGMASSDHAHDNMASSDHMHDGMASSDHAHVNMASSDHVHDGMASSDHAHDNMASSDHMHDGMASSDHAHDNMAPSVHGHDGMASSDHTHVDLADYNHGHREYDGLHTQTDNVRSTMLYVVHIIGRLEVASGLLQPRSGVSPADPKSTFPLVR